MKVLIVHAHHEPASFNAALTRAAVEALDGQGHKHQVSDLYAMGFDPVSDRRNFTTVADPGFLKQQVEEAHATETGGFAADIAAEQDKLLWCDTLIFQFPLWWFGMPAILKGWADRVLAAGKIYGGGRWYDNGMLTGRRAMVSVTTGGPESMYSPTGLNGHIDTLLFPINHGIFYFTGFEVLPPHISWGPAHADAATRDAYLASWQQRVLAIPDTEPIRYPRIADYDATYRLRTVG